MRRLGIVLGLAAIAAVHDPASAQHAPGGRTGQISGTASGSPQSAAPRVWRIDGAGSAFGGGAAAARDGRRVTGTGSNFGRGWERSGDGRAWIGTGANFGRRHITRN
jgi:hypothetical protein